MALFSRNSNESAFVGGKESGRVPLKPCKGDITTMSPIQGFNFFVSRFVVPCSTLISYALSGLYDTRIGDGQLCTQKHRRTI